jgi:hypothetical protein
MQCADVRSWSTTHLVAKLVLVAEVQGLLQMLSCLGVRAGARERLAQSEVQAHIVLAEVALCFHGGLEVREGCIRFSLLASAQPGVEALEPRGGRGCEEHEPQCLHRAFAVAQLREQVRMLYVGRLQTAHGTRVTHRRDARLEAGRVQ